MQVLDIVPESDKIHYGNFQGLLSHITWLA